MGKIQTGGNTTRRRQVKKRVLKKGTVVSTEEDNLNGVDVQKKKVKKSAKTGKDTKAKKRLMDSMDKLNNEVYPPVQIDSSSNREGKATFNISKLGLTQIVSLMNPMSNKVEKSFVCRVTKNHLVVAQEQEGVVALAFIDVDFKVAPKKDLTFVFSKEAIKQLKDVVADFAQFKIFDGNLNIYIADTKLEMGTEDTSDIANIEIDIDSYDDFEYINADETNDIFSRARAITMASAGIFEPTVSLGKNLSCGSEFYLTEIKDCFKKFKANCSPEFLHYILNLSKNAKKELKFAVKEDRLLVMNDVGMLYETANLDIKFPTDISGSFLPANKQLGISNFDSRVLTTSLSKLTIALLGTADPSITIQYNHKKNRADVSVRAINNKTSTDYWNAGDMQGDKDIKSFQLIVSLLSNTISILDNNITMTIYEGFVTMADDTQIVVIATVSE